MKRLTFNKGEGEIHVKPESVHCIRAHDEEKSTLLVGSQTHTVDGTPAKVLKALGLDTIAKPAKSK